MKRILLVGSMKPDRLELYYAKAFVKLGIDLTVFDTSRVLDPFLRNRALRRATRGLRHLLIHRALLSFYRRPTWDAVFVVKGYDLSATTIEACRKRARGVVWSVLNPDSPFENGLGATSRHIRESIKSFDAYFIWSRELVSRLSAVGVAHPFYLPFGYDADTHRSMPCDRIDSRLHRVVSFVGTYDEDRARLLEELCDFPLRIVGGNWERLPRTSPLRRFVEPGIARGEQLRSIAASSAVSLNILRAQNRGAHNMRTFELPAMRGVMLTERSSEQQDFFPERESCFMYSDAAELRETIRSVLAGAYDLEAIRDTAVACSAEHTYVDRAREVCRRLASLS